jgi:hypothetical protein
VDGTDEAGRPRRLAGPIPPLPPLAAIPTVPALPLGLPPTPLPAAIGDVAEGGVSMMPVQAVADTHTARRLAAALLLDRFRLELSLFGSPSGSDSDELRIRVPPT